MITIVSSLTGRALFSMDVDDGVVTLRPEAVRVALVSLQEAGLGDHVVIRSQPNSARVPLSRVLHGTLLSENRVTAGADRSAIGQTEEK